MTKSLIRFLLFCGALTLSPVPVPGADAIDVSGRKDQVLPIDNRLAILEAARRYTQVADNTFPQAVAGIETPFRFEQPVEAIPEPTDEGDAPPEERTPVYDDRTILRLIAPAFSSQVRGTIALGKTRYLQLEGGDIREPGSRFAARLPQLDGKRVEVTLSKITPEGYTLSLGEASIFRPYVESADQNSGAITIDDQ